MKFIHIILAIALFSLGLGAHAADSVETMSEPSLRPVQSSWMLGVGSSHLADTYLTPLKYSGWSSSIGYQRLQVSPWGHNNWVTRLDVELSLDRGQNPARNASMWNVQLQVGWGIMHRYDLPWGIIAAVGPYLEANGGCLYNARNSNNPASAKGAITLDATGYIARTFNVGKLPVAVRYQPTLPVIGAFFSPSYDELYYEIYLGNHSGLVKPAWWGNRFSLDNLITADLKFGATALRLGYGCHWMSSHVENLTTRIITHRMVIGVTVDWTSARRTKNTITPY